MKYVLCYKHNSCGTKTTGILYVPDTQIHVTHALYLSNARVFDTVADAESYLVCNNYSDGYQVAEVSDQELFKAKLAGI